MWNEINPLTRRSAFHTRSVFHARSAFHKSREGFISLRSVLKGTTLKVCTLKDSFQNWIEYITYRQEKDRECFGTLCPLFLTSTAFVDTNAYSEMFCSRKTWNNALRALWNISLLSTWNEINPLTPAGISLAEGKFHARSAFHKSRKGFISLRCVLKGTTLRMCSLFFC